MVVDRRDEELIDPTSRFTVCALSPLCDISSVGRMTADGQRGGGGHLGARPHACPTSA